ncbi:DUF4214 domain-containing protein [Pseudoduganella sp. GCM10020061]|uniref:DUF4214 domain-containing protein n=1 Tax=Pseudoduganella sp. GCM10020061 TaxID=3317345 RepID=UPI00362B8F10
MILNGTEGPDQLAGDTSNDTIYGAGGNDSLDGLSGDDRIDGGFGADTLTGGFGNDWLDGSDGDDELSDQYGDNTLLGGEGDDLLDSLGVGRNRLDAGQGNDTLRGGAGNDTLLGGIGNDRIIITGDYQYTNPVTTVVAQGGDGDDLFELFHKGSGNVVTATGGEGRDTYQFDAAFRARLDITDFRTGPGGDMLNVVGLSWSWAAQGINPFGASGYLRAVQQGADTVVEFDADGAAGSASFRPLVVLRGVQKSWLTADNFVSGMTVGGTQTGIIASGTAQDDMLAGYFLNDQLSGLDGADILAGGNGDDRLDGGSGNDFLQGEDGNDTLLGGTDDDTLDGGAGGDYLAGADGNDILYDEGGNNRLEGGAGNDSLSTSNFGANILDGGSGDDYLTAGFGSDTLIGGAGNDRITIIATSQYAGAPGGEVRALGGDGNDEFTTFLTPGRDATVQATGGAGRDVFRPAVVGTDLFPLIVTDFATGARGDLIDLSLTGPDALTTGFARIIQRGADAVLQFDVDGAEGPADFADLMVMLNVTASQIGSANFGGAAPPPDPDEGTTRTGTASREELGGTDFDDHLIGIGGNDTLDGGAGRDTLDGGTGNDQLRGGDGDDELIGGAGTDFAFFDGPRSAFAITGNGESATVRGIGNAAGTDTLSSVERLVFSDIGIAYDVDGTGGQVYRLYQAAFNRTPDAGGVGFWMAQAEAGVTLDTMAAEFMKSPEFASLYGAAPTNEALVTLFYVNALHREPDAPGLAYWTRVLDNGWAGAAEVLVDMSESPENMGAVNPTIVGGFTFQPFFF